MKKLVIASMLAATVSLVATVDARPHHNMGKPHPMEMMVDSLRGLSLTEAQLNKVKVLIEEFKAEHKPSERERKPTIEAILGMDEAAFYAMIEENVEAKAEHWLALAQLRHEFYTLLTDEQKAQLSVREANRENRRHHRGERRDSRDGDHMARRSNRHTEMFRGLDMTEEQKAQITSLNDNFRQSAKAHEGMIHTFRDEERALVRSDVFSTEAWQTLASNYESQWIDLAVAKAMHKQSLLKVLTTEQLAELEARRQEERLFRSTFRRG